MLNDSRRWTFLAAMSLVVMAPGHSQMPLANQVNPAKGEGQVPVAADKPFEYQVDRFADIRILRYRVDGFEKLTLKQKLLVYYLGEAAKVGRDITYDQFYQHNLVIRKTLDAIVAGYPGDRTSKDWESFMVYVKRVWFANGIHHHYSNDKLVPGFSKAYFRHLLEATGKAGKVVMPRPAGQKGKALAECLEPILFDPAIAPKKIYKGPGDWVAQSSVNFYDGVTQKEVEEYYKALSQTDADKTRPVSHGLNSRLVKRNGKVIEEVASSQGLYAPAIREIHRWLTKALEVSESEAQKKSLQKLMEYYRTGDLKTFDEFCVLWVKDNTSSVDYVNGFIETLDDPMARKGTWEGIVDFKDVEASKRVEILSGSAQWFEDHSPVNPAFKKEKVQGVSARVITAAMLSGGCFPNSYLGINLPNAAWIREQHGSKSVSIGNISGAVAQAALTAKGGSLEGEFFSSMVELERAKKYGALAGLLHTDMHEALGHGSCKLLPTTPAGALKGLRSPIEEARADLFALYYSMDPKLVELGLIPSLEVGKANYDGSIQRALMTQLTRVDPGKSIAQPHMLSRAMVARWVYEKGQPDKVITKEIKNGKTYFVINDYLKLRNLYGQLLAKMQEITSKGLFEEAKAMVEQYGVSVDPVLHREVLDRYAKLNLAPYNGFINPEYLIVEKNGEIVDVKVSYDTDYVKQMLKYGECYSFLKPHFETE